MAPAASDSTAATTSLERTSAASVSASRRHQCDTAGQTRPASARGRNSAAAVTAAARTTSSSHSTSAVMATRIPAMNTMNEGTPGLAMPDAASVPAIGCRTVAACRRRHRRGRARERTSVTARPRRTSSTATPLNSSASGRCTRTARTSIDALWRYDRLDGGTAHQRQDHGRGQRGHDRLVGGEPSGAEVDRRGACP